MRRIVNPKKLNSAKLTMRQMPSSTCAGTPPPRITHIYDGTAQPKISHESIGPTLPMTRVRRAAAFPTREANSSSTWLLVIGAPGHGMRSAPGFPPGHVPAVGLQKTLSCTSHSHPRRVRVGRISIHGAIVPRRTLGLRWDDGLRSLNRRHRGLKAGHWVVVMRLVVQM